MFFKHTDPLHGFWRGKAWAPVLENCPFDYFFPGDSRPVFPSARQINYLPSFFKQWRTAQRIRKYFQMDSAGMRPAKRLAHRVIYKDPPRGLYPRHNVTDRTN